MATPQELQNALMLKKTQGLTTEQAVNQARIPVTATSQINQDRLAQNQASRQALVAPTPITQAPVDQTTGLSTPIAPVAQPTPITSPIPTPITPVAPITAEVKPIEPVKTQVAGKIESPVDYTQAKGREQDIIKNLDTFKAQNMTPEQIMKASGYSEATPEKKALIEPYLKQQVPTASAMYNAIATKADIPDEQKTSLPFKIAQNRYTKASSFSTMTPSQLANEMNNSRFIQGSQAYEDVKAMNPKLVQDTENLRIVNGSKQNIFTTVNNPDGTSTKVNNLEKTFSEDYLDNFGDTIKKMFSVQTPEQIQAIIYTPDVQQAQNKATEIELSMNELEKQINNVDADVDAEMKGSGATGSRIALEKASRKDKLEKEYNSQLKNYTTYANKANNLITQNTSVYTTQQQQQQAQNAAMLPFLTDQYKTEQEKIKAEAALKDPATAIKSVMDEYKKLGIPFTSTVQSRLAEFKASGKPLEQFLTEMSQNIQASPAYKKYQELQAGQLSDVQKLGASQAFDLKKMGMEQDFQMKLAQAKQTTNNKWTKLDDGMYTNESGDIVTADELKTAKLMNNSYITKPIGAVGGECGVYASRSTGMSSTPGGNSKEARTQAFTDKTPQLGGMVFFGGEGYDKTYGHLSYVTAINDDGTMTVRDSNYKKNANGEGIIQERKVPITSATGFYNNTPLAKAISGETTTQPTSTEANSWVNAWNNGTMDIETILTKIGNTKEALPLKNEVIKAIDAQGGVAWRKENDPMVTKVQSLIDTLDNAKKSSYLNTIAGNVQTSLTNFLTGGKSDLLADLKTVIEGGTLQSLIDAKAQGATFGALSNEELKMLQATSSAIAANAIRDPDTKEIIGFKMSESKLKSELEKMKNLLVEKKARMTGAGLKQTQPITQSNTGTINTGGGNTYQGYTITGL